MDGHVIQLGEKINVGKHAEGSHLEVQERYTEHCNSCPVNGFQHLNWIKWTQDVTQRHCKLLAVYNVQHLLQYL